MRTSLQPPHSPPPGAPAPQAPRRRGPARARSLQLRLRPVERAWLTEASLAAGGDLSSICRAAALARAASVGIGEAPPPDAAAIRRALFEAERQVSLVEANLQQLADWSSGAAAFPAGVIDALAPAEEQRARLARSLTDLRAAATSTAERLVERPAREARRTERLHVVLTETEHRVLRAAAAAIGVTVSEFVRGALGRRHGPAPARWPRAEALSAGAVGVREAGRALNRLLADAHFLRRGARPGEPVTRERSEAVAGALAAAVRRLATAVAGAE